MGLFFEKVTRKKSAKPIVILRVLMLIAMSIFLIMTLFNDLNMYFLKYVFVIAGVFSIMDGIESYFHKQSRKVILTEMGVGVVYIILSISIK
ncbi:hypothetical protein PB01_15690 [Psychrobacillus glaciei]|uniref:DUF4181 domain-containing protein n=1 Tax=Psychrobacillus glaciei TaxID=2283160 RepID=A0A5J6SRN9_9BACI|nr:hypothetical protein [Psychrobacillus glaciei]QFG00154.1 hypothetical protein PB01_15690 [Psychrobacillus glaciei]